MASGLEALRNVATFKVYAFEIASSECRISWFQDGFSFFFPPRSVPLSLMLFMHLRSLVLILRFWAWGEAGQGGL